LLTKLVILAALALLSALALSGLNHSLTRFFEGYPLRELDGVWGLRRIYRWRLKRQQERFDTLLAVREDASKEPLDRGRAAWELDRYFPPKRTQLLPTAFGNAVRAFENHASTRYGLDDVVAFPRIDMLLTTSEREPRIETEIDVNVCMNSVIAAVLVGITLVVDQAVHTPQPCALSWLYLIPFVFAYLIHLPMPSAAVRWGSQVRAAIDLHRLQLYDQVGVRSPTSFTDERRVAKKLSYLFMLGIHLDDSLWRQPPAGNGPGPQAGPPSPAPPPPPTPPPTEDTQGNQTTEDVQ
jgi:hypothetical protein